MMKRVIMMVCLISIVFTGCETKQQKDCNHQWNIVKESTGRYNTKYYTVYCPKCKLEKSYVYEDEWKELQLDMGYYEDK